MVLTNRTDAHRERDRLLALFRDAGLTPVLSMNGSNPEADIQFAKVPADEAHSAAEMHGGVEAWLTERGKARLRAVTPPLPHREWLI